MVSPNPPAPRYAKLPPLQMSSANFRALRLESGYSTAEWAQLLGTSAYQIRNCESKRRPGRALSILAWLMSDPQIRARALALLAQEDQIYE